MKPKDVIIKKIAKGINHATEDYAKSKQLMKEEVKT